MHEVRRDYFDIIENALSHLCQLKILAPIAVSMEWDKRFRVYDV